VAEMKRFNILRVSIAGLISLRKVWFWVGVYCLFALWFLLVVARKGEWSDRGIFDLIADVGGWQGGTNHHMFLLVAIPVIVTILTRLVEKLESAFYVLRFHSRFRIWQIQAVSAICLSFFLVILILGISFLIGGMLVGWDNTWLSSKGTISILLDDEEKFQSIRENLSSTRIILTIFITKLLGFLMISMAVLFLKIFIKNSAFIMIILIALVGLDYTGVLHIPIFTMMATLSIQNWIDPLLTLYRSVYLLVLSLIFYAVAGWLYERRDYLS
jgi:hypothetical protein